MPRPAHLHHCTSEPYRFFGRDAELELLNNAVRDESIGVVAFIGPGGQGKTAIAQHWIESLGNSVEGLFLWSFYRGKDADLCLRELLGFATGNNSWSDVSASYCVDRLVAIFRKEQIVVVLDGVEVVQYDSGNWYGRIMHPELSRLVEELASAPARGLIVLTSRFTFPDLLARQHIRRLDLPPLDAASGAKLLTSLGVKGPQAALAHAAEACGNHAKAVELLGTYLARFADGAVGAHTVLPSFEQAAEVSPEEASVSRVLAAFQDALPQSSKDILALATVFREPATEAHLLEYLASKPVQDLLHGTWKRTYPPFADQGRAWVQSQLGELVSLRLLERVHQYYLSGISVVIDAHPLVRRGFEHNLGPGGHRARAQAKAGFLRGRPDRRRSATLEETKADVELFHAFCDAGLWTEADAALAALENPKHRFLAPALERDLLLRFFPRGDWHQPPLWAGFQRYRSLAICFEMLGEFDTALEVYRDADAALRGDALIALGRLQPMLEHAKTSGEWNSLWQAYRVHSLALTGETTKAVELACTLVPVDIYEWVHVFEGLLRAGQLQAIDLRSVLYRSGSVQEHRWSELARTRMRLDSLRIQSGSDSDYLRSEYESLLAAYERQGLPYERLLTRIGFARLLILAGDLEEAERLLEEGLPIARRFKLRIMEVDFLEILKVNCGKCDLPGSPDQIRNALGYWAQSRP